MALTGLIIGGMIMVALAASKHCPVWIAIIVGTFIIGTFAGLPFTEIIFIVTGSMATWETIEILILAAFALYLGRLMSELGHLQNLKQTLGEAISNPFVPIAAIPALIGCIPVAGGAILSAPIVHTLTTEQKIPAPRGAAINLVFRHFMPVFLPFAPPLVLAARMADVHLPTLSGFLALLSLCMTITGIFYFLYNKPIVKRSPGQFTRQSAKNLIIYASPLCLALLLAIVSPGPVFIGPIVGVIVAIMIAKKPSAVLLFGKSLDAEILLAIPVAIGLRGILLSSGALEQATQALSASGIPLWVVCLALPGLVSLSSGNLLTTAVVSFPVVVGLMPAGTELAYSFLTYGSGFLFYFASPLHLCQIVTIRYFNCTALQLYREYIAVIPALAVGLILMFFLLLHLYGAS